ncbi:hypothetical protein [Deinococcus aerophilus]|uniref:DUF1795 domain-containing protein n=1 Tax=Deinococcus aerophilus TaxID=522488 RepID=A0ABQ2GSA4_9DEIO|nr:hypothetical protein [Deinococcus aerophilus]GGM10904.1 hypothetical protein GCM10010841_19220 [Deinococcus aerophilus]
MIRPFLTVSLLTGLSIASVSAAVPVKLDSLPLSVEPNAKLLTLNTAGIRAAFPSAAGRPDAVFMTEDRKVSVAFEWRTSKLASNELDKLVTQFPAVIRSQVPNIKTLKSGLIQVGGTPWAQFVFTTPSQGDDLRRELMVTSLGGRMLVLTIAGNVKDYSRNEAVVRNLTNSVRLN